MVTSASTAARRAAKPLSRAVHFSASPWRLYEGARSAIADGTIDLELGTFRVALFGRQSNCLLPELSRFADLTGELSAGKGYRRGGETFSTWFDGNSDTLVFGSETLLGNWIGRDDGLKAWFAVIYQDDHAQRPLLCFSKLKEGRKGIAVTQGMRFSLAATAIFTLSGRA